MGVVDAKEAAGLLSNPLGAATPGGMSQILDLLKVINDIAHSPLANMAASRFQNNRGSNITQAPIVENIPPLQAPVSSPQPAAIPPAKPAKMSQQDMIAFISSPEGQKTIADGLKMVIMAKGDIKLSELVKELEPGNKNEPQPTS
jgi:hypothetical protein